MKNRSTKLLWVLLLAPLLAVGFALVTQHAFDMLPCAWCVLQRLIFVCISLVAAVALLLRAPLVRAGLGVLIALLAASGIASALYQHFVAARAASCNRTLAGEIVNTHLHLDALLPSVFGTWASCADAAVSLLGIPYEFWSLALFVLLTIAAWLVVRRPG